MALSALQCCLRGMPAPWCRAAVAQHCVRFRSISNDCGTDGVPLYGSSSRDGKLAQRLCSDPHVTRPLGTLYCDAATNFVVVNKPSGIPVFDPTRDSVSQRLLRGIPWRHQVHLAHRIDKATQGILICAFTSAITGELARGMRQGRWLKCYRALCQVPRQAQERAQCASPTFHEGDGLFDGVSGQLRERGVLVSYMNNQPMPVTHPVVHGVQLHRSIAASDPEYGPRIAKTEFALVHWDEEAGLALYDIVLHTGRTHQIRVHFAEAGAPLVNDWYYNPNCMRWSYREVEQNSLCLQAYHLDFPHPATVPSSSHHIDTFHTRAAAHAGLHPLARQHYDDTLLPADTNTAAIDTSCHKQPQVQLYHGLSPARQPQEQQEAARGRPHLRVRITLPPTFSSMSLK